MRTRIGLKPIDILLGVRYCPQCYLYCSAYYCKLDKQLGTDYRARESCTTDDYKYCPLNPNNKE